MTLPMFLGLSSRPYQTSHEDKVDKNLVENKKNWKSTKLLRLEFMKDYCIS